MRGNSVGGRRRARRLSLVTNKALPLSLSISRGCRRGLWLCLGENVGKIFEKELIQTEGRGGGRGSNSESSSGVEWETAGRLKYKLTSFPAAFNRSVFASNYEP